MQINSVSKSQCISIAGSGISVVQADGAFSYHWGGRWMGSLASVFHVAVMFVFLIRPSKGLRRIVSRSRVPCVYQIYIIRYSGPISCLFTSFSTSVWITVSPIIQTMNFPTFGRWAFPLSFPQETHYGFIIILLRKLTRLLQEGILSVSHQKP